MGIEIRYLNGADIAALALDDHTILASIEACLKAQGLGQTVIEPRMHLMPGEASRGHFNVLRGYLEPTLTAGVKVVGDFVDNYQQGLPSEFALINLMDATTGAPRAIVDGTEITNMRTGAVTAIGAKYLAGANPRVLGHIGARGTAYWNVRLLDHLFDFEEIKVHSRRAASREDFARRLSADLGKDIKVTQDWRSCLEDADIMVEASRLDAPQVLFETKWIKPGALVVPYGTMSAVADDIIDHVDAVVVDHWPQCLIGPFGSLRRHVDAGIVTQNSIRGELGAICAGQVPGRLNDEETVLLWHRGLSTTDIALAQTCLDLAAERDIGSTLPYA